jgi:hypothetical protein
MAAAIAGALAAGALGSILSGSFADKRQRRAMEEKARQLEEMKKAIENGYQMPEFNQEPLTTEEFAFLEAYVPELAEFVADKAPETVTEAGSRQEIRTQREALQRLMQQSQQGDDAIARASREKALGDATAREQSLRQRALSQLAQQGMLSGADRLTAEQEAISSSMAQARAESLQAAAQQQARRQEALARATQLADNMRRSNLAKERSNVDIMNQFNQRATMRRQQHLDKVAQTRNQAQQYNNQMKQEIANRNTALRNAMAKYEQQRRDRYEQARVDAANQKLGMQQGIATTQYNNTQVQGPDMWERGLQATSGGLMAAGVKALGNELGSADTSQPTTSEADASILDVEEAQDFNNKVKAGYTS